MNSNSELGISLDVEKDWVENSEYLKKLCALVVNTGLDNLDSNLLYEVAYAKTYISIVKSKESKIDSSLLNDCETLFNDILLTTDYDKAAKLKTKDYKNLLKCKYRNEEDAYVTKKAYRERDSMFFVLTNLFVPEFVLYLVSTGVLFGVTSEGFKEILTTILNSDGIGNKISPELSKFIMYASYTVTGVISIVLMVIALFRLIRAIIDLAYCTLPIVSVLGVFDKYVSKRAKDVLASKVSTLEVVEKVKDYNRITRNKAWLNAMIEVERVSDGNFFIDGHTLKSIRKKLEKGKGSGYYLALAQVEFLHNTFLEFCKSC